MTQPIINRTKALLIAVWLLEHGWEEDTRNHSISSSLVRCAEVAVPWSGGVADEVAYLQERGWIEVHNLHNGVVFTEEAVTQLEAWLMEVFHD